MKNNIIKSNNLPETRDEIKTYITNVKERLLLGDVEPMQVFKMLKVYEVIIDELKHDEKIMEMVQNEADKFQEKTFEVFGCKFTKQERPTFDFSVCNDSELTIMENEAAMLATKIKERKDFLKVIPENFVSMDTGEILNRPLKTSKSIIAVTLK
jgi:hypothetical protein